MRRVDLVGQDDEEDEPGPAGAEAATVVMRREPQDARADIAGADAATMAMRREPQDAQDDIAGADAATMAMPIVRPLGDDDAKTMALPIQRPAGTDKVQGQRPLSKPPTTPRPAPGPKQAGPQGPAGPHQAGPQGPPPSSPDEVEDTRPSPPRPAPQQRQVASAPSPADLNATRPAQSVMDGAGQRPPQQHPQPQQPRPMAQPQRVPPAPPTQTPAAEPAPAGRSKRWLLVAGAAAAVLVLVLVGLFAFAGSETEEDKVRTAIGDYTSALRDGDLPTLRDSTCGPLHDFYQNIPDDQFAGVHRLSEERKNIPVVDSIDAIRITDGTAIAQATVYTDADPSKRSARTFDLERTDNGWKVCDPPAGTP